MRRLFIGLSVAILAASVALPAAATEPPDHKVTICHALPGSASHAYNVITVDIASSGYVKGGHSRGLGPDEDRLGEKHAHGGDIIPPYTYTTKRGEVFSFPGQNWTDEGQAIYHGGGDGEVGYGDPCTGSGDDGGDGGFGG